MGIKHLKMLLEATCKKSGIHHFSSIKNFVDSEKIRMYKNYVKQNNIHNPVKQMRIKKFVENKPYFIGIDACLYAARYKRVFKKIEVGFLRQIMLSLSAKMIPIYVFDGNAPVQKRKTILNRQLRKQKIRIKLEKNLLVNKNIKPEDISLLSLEDLVCHVNNIHHELNKDGLSMNENEKNCHKMFGSETTDLESDGSDPSTGYLLYDSIDTSDEYNEFVRLSKKGIATGYDDLQNLKIFLDILKIPYVTASNEADDLMALLYKKGIIQACQSDDMDMLPKGCANVIQFTKEGVTQYLLSEILEELGLEHVQLVDLCILLGSDYYSVYLPKIKPVDLYDKFKSLLNPCLENFVDFYSKNDPKIELHLDAYKDVRNSFLILSEDLDKDMINYHLVPFSFEKIEKYFKKIGLQLTKTYNNKIRSMIKIVNEIISSSNNIMIHI
jgi:hypothetical protein